ncbi:non-canonical purine NTP diphosphatase [Sinomicrobium weinanense]|uniref:dITP/XTP pyrophosphatase n=1 Tax=Sinomicrobium weinanense TaxID=2842200 RepID=A0A926JV55_9FLAO|nr:non-canonical purine NTP diphosphatase [Sinomicrobium weinanense]MBC9797894.1 non-canonical purine NTP diphosphatase [Sinomicrobium weinanense]MBU3122768.1 non-canonical purine NTP diphosphatase [Sinomicrobium weinanense]
MKLVFATHNKNKLHEVKALLPDNIALLGLDDIGCDEDIPETSDTIEGNAIQKADYIKEKYGYDCFADDTGLEVDALDGAPGVYSARYAGEAKNTDDNIEKLLRELRSKENRNARFKTVIALHLNGERVLFDGIVKGRITEERSGKGGFGYDPIFLPEGYEKTFGELPLEVKNRISHRARAVNQLIDYLKEMK